MQVRSLFKNKLKILSSVDTNVNVLKYLIVVFDIYKNKLKNSICKDWPSENSKRNNERCT
jgi:hypothetical protein